MPRSLSIAVACLSLGVLATVAVPEAKAYHVRGYSGSFGRSYCYPSYCSPSYCYPSYCSPSCYCPPISYCPPTYCPPATYCSPCYSSYCSPCYSGYGWSRYCYRSYGSRYISYHGRGRR